MTQHGSISNSVAGSCKAVPEGSGCDANSTNSVVISNRLRGQRGVGPDSTAWNTRRQTWQEDDAIGPGTGSAPAAIGTYRHLSAYARCGMADAPIIRLVPTSRPANGRFSVLYA